MYKVLEFTRDAHFNISKTAEEKFPYSSSARPEAHDPTCFSSSSEVSKLVSYWCFEPSQSGLTETYIKRYRVERTSEAEIRPEEQ